MDIPMTEHRIIATIRSEPLDCAFETPMRTPVRTDVEEEWRVECGEIFMSGSLGGNNLVSQDVARREHKIRRRGHRLGGARRLE